MDASVEAATVNPITIEMVNGAAAMKEIYYADGRGSIFTYKATRRALLLIFVSLLFCAFFYLCSFSNQGFWIFLLVLGILALIGTLLFFFMNARPYFIWRRSTDLFLKELSKKDKQTLIITPHVFELKNEVEDIIEKWKNIKKAHLDVAYIVLDSESGMQYIFPAKSMNASQYEQLTELIRRKMNDPAAVQEMPS